MKPALVQTTSVLRRLVLAIPDAWRSDVVFRSASIGAGACLLGLLLNDGAKQMAALPVGLPPLPPPSLVTAPTPSPPVPVPAPSSAAAVEPLRIAPGRELNNLAVVPATPDADRFGTISPRR